MLSKSEVRALAPRRRTRALLVRHGVSTFNLQQRCQGRSDEPVLTDSGAAAAAQAGRRLTTEHVDVLVSSPLRRARQTAEIIAAILRKSGQDNVAVTTSDDLAEIRLPEWEGFQFEIIRQQFADSHRIWSDEPHQFRMSLNGRSAFFPVLELFEQASRFWRGLLRRHAGLTAVLVTHGGTASALISTAVGFMPERFHSLQLSHCGISALEFPAGSNTAKIEALNLTTHLRERMPKLKLGRRGTRIVMIAGDSSRQHGEDVSAALDAVPIDFVLSADDPESGEMARALLQARPHAHPGILPGRILFDAVHPKTPPLASPLASTQRAPSTGIFVGRASDLDAFLCAAVGIDPRSSPWKQASNIVVHYPAAGRRPVIQAFNMPLWKEAPEAAEVRL